MFEINKIAKLHTVGTNIIKPQRQLLQSKPDVFERSNNISFKGTVAEKSLDEQFCELTKKQKRICCDKISYNNLSLKDAIRVASLSDSEIERYETIQEDLHDDFYATFRPNCAIEFLHLNNSEFECAKSLNKKGVRAPIAASIA